MVYTNAEGLTTTVQIPAGAVAETIVLVYTPVATFTHPIPPDLRFASHAFGLEAYRGGILLPGFGFGVPVTVTVYYTDTDVTGLDESTLSLKYWNGSMWAGDGIVVFDRNTADDHVVFTIIHLSDFAVFGSAETRPYKVSLPAALRK